jgi:TetR/AcrR family transcriptional regulator, transcriptional repressor for nem operon
MGRTKNFDESQVLDKALEVFWKKGFNATSIQDLVDHLGINRASIYDTYGDKHKLYLASLKRYRQQTSSWLLQQIRSEKSALGIIKDFLIGTVQQGLHDPERLGCFLVNAATELANSDDAIQLMFEENKNTVEKVLNELIIEGQESGEIATKHSSEALARFLFNTLSGLRVLAKGNMTEKELNEIVEVTLSALD